MTETPTEAFTRRMRRYRERRGWTQEALSRELVEVGWKVDRAQIARIESGDRGLSLDEAVMIAWALGLPPAFLYLPVGEAPDIALAPGVVVHPDLARKWATGVEAAPTSDQEARLLGEWHTDLAVWRLHDRLDAAQDAEHRARAAISSAEYVGEGVEVARRAHVEAMQRLADALDLIETNGLRAPELHPETIKAMKRAGIWPGKDQR